MSDQRRRPNYGIDAPIVVRNLALAGVVAVGLGFGLDFALGGRNPVLGISLLFMGLCPGLGWLATAGIMIWGSKVGKLRLRDRVLDSFPLRGDETVLDAGCGHGLMLIGKRLTTGEAIGVDIWQAEDQADNRAENTLENARIEGAADRVQVLDRDLRKLTFADATFDVILSSWAIHNIYNPRERQQAVRELARVLKPRGRLVILDVSRTREYVDTLQQCGMNDVTRSLLSFTFVIPTFLVQATKPRVPK